MKKDGTGTPGEVPLICGGGGCKGVVGMGEKAGFWSGVGQISTFTPPSTTVTNHGTLSNGAYDAVSDGPYIFFRQMGPGGILRFDTAGTNHASYTFGAGVGGMTFFDGRIFYTAQRSQGNFFRIDTAFTSDDVMTTSATINGEYGFSTAADATSRVFVSVALGGSATNSTLWNVTVGANPDTTKMATLPLTVSTQPKRIHLDAANVYVVDNADGGAKILSVPRDASMLQGGTTVDTFSASISSIVADANFFYVATTDKKLLRRPKPTP